MTQRPDYPRIRRVVTGHDAEGTAKPLLDGAATNEKYPDAGMISTLLWSTDGTPAQVPIGAFEDMGERKLGSAPAANGTRFAILDFPPGNPAVRHRTDTLDYVIVLEGEIDMDMDDTSVRLRAGDVLIQRGTNHAWSNRSAARARIAVVLIDAQPLPVPGALVRGATASAGTE